jgi:CPA2 family monovalent cation:H+ antiporter-2
VAVGWLIVEDIATVLALVLLPAQSGVLGGTEGNELTRGDSPLGALLTAILFTLFKVGAFLLVMLLVGRRVIPWILGRVAATGSRELFTLCVLSIALGVAFGSAELFGVSFALGAFFAGMLLSESEFSQEAAEETLPLRDAFAVLFFVSVGMLFDPRFLLENMEEVLAVLAIVVVGKSLAAYVIVRLFGRPHATALTIAVSLAQIGEFSFILAALGVSLDILPEEGQALVLAGALLSIVLNPLLFELLGRLLGKRGTERNPVAHTGSVIPEDLAGHALLVGYGRVGRELALLLVRRGVPLVVVEEDGDRVLQARAEGLTVVRGDATSETVLEEARARGAALAIIAVPQAIQSAEIVGHLKSLSPGITVLARAHSEQGVALLLGRGAEAAVLAERELAHSLAEMVMAAPPYRALRTAAPA